MDPQKKKKIVTGLIYPANSEWAKIMNIIACGAGVAAC